jgi:hypothetical protein
MKILKFTTITERTFEVSFNEDAFFDYMKRCGYTNLKIENQVSLYLNNLHERLLVDVPYDSVQSIEYKFSKEFREQYNDISDLLKYDL